MNPQEWMHLQLAAEDEDVEEELDEDDDDDEDEEDDEDDEDDEVGTDERGKEMLKLPGDRDDTDADTEAEPDVSSDRSAPSEAPSSGRAPLTSREPPLSIKQIEDIEDDAPGG
jgi:hypothetical protein